jgi:hypothetical protein
MSWAGDDQEGRSGAAAADHEDVMKGVPSSPRASIPICSQEGRLLAEVLLPRPMSKLEPCSRRTWEITSRRAMLVTSTSHSHSHEPRSPLRLDDVPFGSRPATATACADSPALQALQSLGVSMFDSRDIERKVIAHALRGAAGAGAAIPIGEGAADA